jgi:hypothetical protein
LTERRGSDVFAGQPCCLTDRPRLGLTSVPVFALSKILRNVWMQCGRGNCGFNLARMPQGEGLHGSTIELNATGP